MMYHIFVDGDLKASFEMEADRDICLDALIDYWGDDCNFSKEVN